MISQTPKVQAGAKFNYEVLDSQQRIDVQQATEAIRERLKKAAQDIWEIGKSLSVVQSTLKRGQFDEWLETEFDWSRRTAYKFISVYKRFDHSINLEEINIATSALYLLAAESTPKEIREEFLQKAQHGEKITHQEVRQVVQESKAKSMLKSEQLELSQTSPATQKNPQVVSLEPIAPKQQLISIIPQPETEEPISDSNIPLKFTVNPYSIDIDKGWYKLGQKHNVFCGDTALPEFANNIPYATLAIAVTSDDWAHDWLIEKAKTVVVFPESEFERQKLTGLIVMFSSAEDIIVFPWLPEEEMIVVAHQLGRTVYAGDMDHRKCQSAIIKTNLFSEKIVS